jgi:GNAT superfamily N-acetyltransferase
MNKLDLLEFSNHIEIKYIDILQEINLEFVDGKRGQYINFNVLNINKHYRSIGFGTKIMSELCKFADKHNVRVELYPTNLFGANLKRLIKFCNKHGFIMIGDIMVYMPVKLD